VLNYVGYTLVESGGDLREAETLLSRAVELRPDDGAIADSYGFCLLRLGRAPEALVELKRADQLAPNDPVILSHLGDALLATGHRDEALDAFRRALARLAPPAHKTERRQHPQASVADPPDRLPEPGDAKVRAELLQKVRSLQSP
jgi:Flp pilus assembly protein TadD